MEPPKPAVAATPSQGPSNGQMFRSTALTGAIPCAVCLLYGLGAASACQRNRFPLVVAQPEIVFLDTSAGRGGPFGRAQLAGNGIAGRRIGGGIGSRMGLYSERVQSIAGSLRTISIGNGLQYQVRVRCSCHSNA